MYAHDPCSLPVRRSFIRKLVRLGLAGVTLSALKHSELMWRPAYAQQVNNNGNSSNNNNGNSSNNNNNGSIAPEISAGAAVGALALLSGGALLLSDRFRRRSRTQ
jgi:hypothetical protein